MIHAWWKDMQNENVKKKSGEVICNKKKFKNPPLVERSFREHSSHSEISVWNATRLPSHKFLACNLIYLHLKYSYLNKLISVCVCVCVCVCVFCPNKNLEDRNNGKQL